jgi:hypothetical protein
MRSSVKNKTNDINENNEINEINEINEPNTINVLYPDRVSRMEHPVSLVLEKLTILAESTKITGLTIITKMTIMVISC